MKVIFGAIISISLAILCCSCDKDLVEYKQDDIKVMIGKGDEWLHNFPLFLGISKKTPPQIAIWVEDTQGNYITSIYVTHKIATESWKANKGNRRKEALPVWCYARNVKYPDGLYLPTKDKPLTDGISGATPHGSFDVKISPLSNFRKFIIKVELNHSVDWNNNYPENAKEGDVNYSGGKEGSGQPAVVYAAEIDLDSGNKQFNASLIGHSSPDGTNGNLYPDTSGLSTALRIVKQIIITIK